MRLSLLTAIVIYAQTARCQTPEIEAIYGVSDSLNSFALKLLAQTSKVAGDSRNIAISPYTIWTLLTIIAEGARGNSEKQLETALSLPAAKDRSEFRRNFKLLSKYLMQTADGVDVQISNAIFTTADYPLNQTFQQLTQSYYGVDALPVNFTDIVKAVQYIQNYVQTATKGRVTNFIHTDDIIDAQIFMMSTFYFKGQWKLPFNKTATHTEPFYDETANQIGQVMMMSQIGPFPYARVDSLHAHAVELSYGKAGKMSMFVILPRKGHTLSEVLSLIASVNISTIIDVLADAEEQFMDEDVEVYLPRFNIHSDFNMNIVLDQMGIKDIFDEELADLLGMLPQYLYVSRIVQRAEIEVNEEGTIASAVAGATLVYKSPPPVFRANRPFAFLIVDRQTRSIVFAGKVTNPNTLT